jgi:hypothetical protein
MTNLLVPTDVDQTLALDWLRYSLGQGEVISPAALRFIEERKGRAYTLAPTASDPARLATPRWGGLIAPGVGSLEEAVARVLATLAERGAACVIVEDELRLKRDPKPSLDGLLLTGFVDEKVIHWAPLVDGTEAALLTLHRGSHGYPTNAFVTSASVEELGLVDGADLEADIGDLVVESLVAVTVSAYDDETYLIWEPI